MNKSLPALLALLSLIIGGGGGYYLGQKNISAQNAQAKKELPETQDVLKLPPGAIQISKCVPFKGEHWVEPENLPYGPMYTIHNGKIVSMEYMFTENETPGLETSKMNRTQIIEYLDKNKMTYMDFIEEGRRKFDLPPVHIYNFDISQSAAHSGFAKPHFDIHFYFVSREESAQVCPDATFQSVVTPELLRGAQDAGIPVPGAPAASASATPKATGKN